MISGSVVGVRSRSRRSADSSRACGSARARICGFSPASQRQAVVVDHDQHAVALDDRPLGGEVERHDRDVLAGRCTARRRARSSSTAGRRGCSRRLICARCRGATAPAAGSSGPSGAAALRKEKTRSLARDFSSSRRAPPKAASKPCWSSACLSALASSSCRCGAREPWVNGLMPSLHALLVDVHDAGRARARCAIAVAERDHLAELPGGVDVQQRERRLGRDRTPSCARCSITERVLADRIEHHRVLGTRRPPRA